MSVVEKLKLRDINGNQTPYEIGAHDTNIVLDDSSNKFLVNNPTNLKDILPLKFNNEIININKDFNKIDKTGYYTINTNITDNNPFEDSSNSSLLVLNNIQIAFKDSEVYTRSGFSGTWSKGLGTDFTPYIDSSNTGTRGLVPKPPTNSQTGNYFLNASGNWTTLNNKFARLGESEKFTGTPIFNAGFTSNGTITINKITGDNTITNASIYDTGIGAFNKVSIKKNENSNSNDTVVIDNDRNGIFNSINVNDNVTISNEGIVVITNDTEASTNSTKAGALQVTGGIYSGRKIYANDGVYGAVWNDLADSIAVNKDVEIEAGYCYCLKDNKYVKSSKYLDNGIIGIHSDTYGFKMGEKAGEKQLDCAVAGFVLAYVDKDYLPGTALTCTKDGRLTKMKSKDKQRFPEKIVATYWKNEPNEEWGSDNRKVKVNGRKWVKIK